MHDVTVIGLGYIGLPTAILFASKGYKVQCVDINSNLIKNLKLKKVQTESELKDKFIKNYKNFSFYERIKDTSKLFIICVPTPIFKNKFDSKPLDKAINSLIPFLNSGSCISIESTIPPGITLKICRSMLKNFEVGKDIFLAHVPESALVGNLYQEMIRSTKVIGGVSKECSNKISKFYKKICNKIICTDSTSAELAKTFQNTYRNVNIALSCELENISNNFKLDIKKIIQLANLNPRVNIHFPSGGVGGHCIPVDPLFLLEQFPNSKILNESIRINENRPHQIYNKIKNLKLKDKVIGVYGLSYKPNTDDYRNSPSLKFINYIKKSCEYYSYDPHIKNKIEENQIFNFKTFLSKIDFLIVYVKHNHIINKKIKIDFMV